MIRRLVLLLCWTSLVVAATPQRIVSLKPNITEILFALGAGERVVGVTTWCNIPAAAQKLPKIADYIRPNVEAIAALRPDLVISSEENSQAAPIMQLRALKIPVTLLPFATIDDTLRSIRALGAATNTGDAARTLVDHLTHALAPRTLPRSPRVLQLVGTTPPIAAGPASLLGELLARTGAHNLITTRTPAYPQLSPEAVLALRPDRILLAASDANMIDVRTTLGTTAPIVTIDPDLFRPGPRMDQAFQALQRAIEAR